MRRSQPFSRLAATLVTGVALAAPVRGGAQVPAPNQPEVQTLRVCADPDDLPFSSAKPGTPGLYVELGQQIAQALGRTYEPVWSLSYFGKFTVRTTLLAKTCDVYVGLPGVKGFMGPKVVYSKPFLHIGYAIMARADAHITKLSDLAGKSVAVQFSTPPQMLVATRDDIRSVTFLNPEDAATALDHHEVDVAFIWGPTAGYLNATAYHGAYQVTPIAGDGMQYPVKVGFARANEDLRDQVDHVLEGLHPLVARLAVKYSLPTEPPVALASLRDVPDSMIVLAETSETVEQPAAAPPAASPPAASPPAEAVAEPAAPPADAAAAPAQAASADDVAAGQHIFNGTCSHCHGPNAVQSVKRIDLRLLHHRYGDETESVYHETVTKGRPAKGMPNWSKVFTEDDFKKIYAYLSTIQND